MLQERDVIIKTKKSLVDNGKENEYIIKKAILYKFENGRSLLVVSEKMQGEIILKMHNKG